MPDSNHDSWLASYYSRIQSECTLSIERRDRLTRLCYMVLAAGIAIFISFSMGDDPILSLGRFGLVVGISIVLTRFFFQSMIAYGFFHRWNHLRNQIEQNWMNGSPPLDKVKDTITEYDHKKAIPITHWSLIKGQILSGFGLILVVPIILLAIELCVEHCEYHYWVLGGLICYVIYEIVIFKTYKQMRYVKKQQP